MCWVFPNSGIKISAARTALSRTTDMTKARRRTLRSRLCCSASPSTKHPLNDPRPSWGLSSLTFLGSGHITTSTILSASADRSVVPQIGTGENLRRRFPGGCSRSPGDRRRARRDVRLRASSFGWTPRVPTSSQQASNLRTHGQKEAPKAINKLFLMNRLQPAYPGVRLMHLMFCGRGSVGGRPPWIGVIWKL